MPRYLLPLIAALALHAGVTDFHTLSKAKAAYEQGDFAAAAEQYGALHGKNDQARFNYGDALYKEQKYKEAAEAFSQISTPALKQKALHNLGNSLANLGKTDEAIKAYENALKLGEDKDTRYNLDLLKKQQQKQKQQNSRNDQKKQEQNKQDQKKQDQKNQQQNGQDKQNQQDKQQQQNGNSQQGQNGQEKQNEPQPPNDQQSQQQRQKGQTKPENADEKETKKQQERESAAKAADAQQDKAQSAMAEPISDMEERKYNNMLDKRGIKTLMIPLSGKGEPHADETTPW